MTVNSHLVLSLNGTILQSIDEYSLHVDIPKCNMTVSGFESLDERNERKK